MRRLAIISVLLLTRPAPAADVDFAHDVLPLLKARCSECHTNGKYKGGVSFDTRSEAVKKAIAAGKSGDSLLVKRITAKDPEERMPPKGPPLTDKEVAVFKAWIDAGAHRVVKSHSTGTLDATMTLNMAVGAANPGLTGPITFKGTQTLDMTPA